MLDGSFQMIDNRIPVSLSVKFAAHNSDIRWTTFPAIFSCQLLAANTWNIRRLNSTS